MERRQITEESGEHKHWYEEARQMTAEKLPAFIDKLINGYNHDYGTICHAIAAAAMAGAWSVEKSPQGGITGFQAGAIMWEMIRAWGVFGDGPMRMIIYDNMLYPQYAVKFRSITSDTWKWLQEKAHENLKQSDAHEAVRAHWQSIADGEIPFGYTIEQN